MEINKEVFLAYMKFIRTNNCNFKRRGPDRKKKKKKV